ncbi:glutathione S-transferase [Patellaria atrata CBS 101060]|uniref:Glutathione S-transferase n=1 Tax=Patellaria atrata CBS 101060 TaxID=1346257 RepID=A0A9P4S175_9PEZI|nr:glutathione S-transferase [Patellaria atrata CBS 101060]
MSTSESHPEERSPKKQRTEPTYTLIYWPSIPGRGEYVRLALEAAGASYIDLCNTSSGGVSILQSFLRGDDIGSNPPIFAPPALQVAGEGLNGEPLLIHQTANILRYLGGRLELDGENEQEALWTAQLAMTALDANNESHNTHHPIAVAKYYEEQKEEAKKVAFEFRTVRVPKFFSYFERVLKWNEAKGQGKYLVGKKLTYADTTLWQVMDGLHYAFPMEMAYRKQSGAFPLLFEKFYPGIENESGIKEYLASERRLPYSEGIWRHYLELDRRDKDDSKES